MPTITVNVSVIVESEAEGEHGWQVVDVSENKSLKRDENLLIVKNVRVHYGRMLRELEVAKKVFREKKSLDTLVVWVALRSEFRLLRELVKMFPREKDEKRKKEANA